jgi:hypothetical protein
MSTPQPDGVKAERRGQRALFHRLFDDAAVFPPRLTPLPRAVADHRARSSSSYADLVGPLLLPASAADDLLSILRSRPEPGLEEPLGPGSKAGQEAAPDVEIDVAVVGRPGTDLAVVGQALSRLAGDSGVRVVGVETGWSPDWHQARRWAARDADPRSLGVLRSIEVPRGAEMEAALSDLQAHADDPDPVQAKFRTGSTAGTGSTPGQKAPTSTEVATFIRACVDHDLSFKLTGGLHHAISSTASGQAGPGSEDRLGFLNVIAATRWALAHGAEVPEMSSLLSQRDPVPILDIITRMSEADVSVVRAFFTSYGCCGVMDPIGDLAAFGLIRETTTV